MVKRVTAGVPPILPALVFLLSACGGGEGTGPESQVARVEVEPAAGLAVGVGATVQYGALVLDASGRRVSGVGVTWSAGSSGVATVNGSGLATAVGAGTTDVVATAEGVRGTASLEVWDPPAVAAYQPGISYYGRERYVEYIPGELPLVISAPHGGDLEPSEIPDRTFGTTVTDANTRETLIAVREAFIARTGKAPHIIISHLRRSKLDPNREIVEAAQGNPFAENAWGEFQAFIETASALVVGTYGSGFYVDLHGHGHAIARAELGYLLGATTLNGTDDALDAGNAEASSSIRALSEASPLSFSALLRGEKSLGGYMAREGILSVPSPADPSPGSAEYFTGGYNTERHGSRAPGRTVSGVQVELPRPGIRDTDANRRVFAAAFASAVEAFMLEHYGFFTTPG